MTSRPAAPESPVTEQCSICLAHPPYGDCAGDESCAYILMLERQLQLAQTEIKGHMRVVDDLQMRIAELEKDAARWKKGVSDGEFPIRRSWQWMHVSRTSGRILTGDTPEEVIDAALKDRA